MEHIPPPQRSALRRLRGAYTDEAKEKLDPTLKRRLGALTEVLVAENRPKGDTIMVLVYQIRCHRAECAVYRVKRTDSGWVLPTVPERKSPAHYAAMLALDVFTGNRLTVANTSR